MSSFYIFLSAHRLVFKLLLPAAPLVYLNWIFNSFCATCDYLKINRGIPCGVSQISPFSVAGVMYVRLIIDLFYPVQAVRLIILNSRKLFIIEDQMDQLVHLDFF